MTIRSVKDGPGLGLGIGILSLQSMIEVLNVPIIELQVRWLRKFGIKDFVMCVGYMKEQIIDHIGNGAKFDSRIDYSFEEKALGTGGALLNAKQLISNQGSFFVLNGDILTELDPNRLNIANSNVLAVVPLRSPFGMVELDV